MGDWKSGWGSGNRDAGNPEAFKISRVEKMDGAINADMFRKLDLELEHQETQTVGADERGEGLLKATFDYKFVTSFNEEHSEAVSVMTRCGFIPLGVARDGAAANAPETIFVLINERVASLSATPYMSTEIYRNMLAVLAEKLNRTLVLKLVRVDSTVVNRVIDYIYYRIEIHDDSEEDTEVMKPLSVDVQPGETGVIMQARSWFREALNRGASDIHIEPMDNGLGRIRLRVNGVLEVLERRVANGDLLQVVTWVKAQSRMDISEKRKPLDGSVRISFMDSGVQRLVDVRVSTIPTAFGQKMVMRLLDPGRLKKMAAAGLAGTIWDETLRKQFEQALGMRDGIVLVTGPTGSGKTSTLNVALMHLLNDNVFGDRKNIATIEDPIEYTISGANQTQTNDAAGVTFAKMLRALLRQDPDIILVGEIRDNETAQIAVQAALTGHMILATLHTNDALGAVDRLKDLGISPFLIGSTLRMTQAQRLVRKLCKECGRRNQITGEELARKVDGSQFRQYRERLLEPGGTIYEHSECAYCNWTGFDGRVAVMEMVPTSPALVRGIEKGLSSRQLYAEAISDGFRPMLQNGVEMIRAGLTSIAEMESISLASVSDD